MHTTPPNSKFANTDKKSLLARAVLLVSQAMIARWHVFVFVFVVLCTQMYAIIWASWTRVIDNPDVQLHYWTIWWWSQALRDNPMSVWDAPQFAPYSYTLAFSDHFAALGIVTAPFVWLHVPLGFIVNSVFVLCALATIWSISVLARDDGALLWPSVLVSLAVTFGAFRSAHLVHLQMQMTWMLPLVVLLMKKALHTPKIWSWSLGSLLVVLSSAFSLSSYHALMMLPVMGMTALVTLMMAPQSTRISMFIRFVQIVVIGSLVMLPSLWPYMQAQQITDINRTYSELDNWSAPLQSWFAVSVNHPLWPKLFGDIVVGRPELVLAPGLLLSVGSLVMLRYAGRAQILWILIVVMGWLLASGTTLRMWDGGSGIELPFTKFLLQVPGYSALRVPARWGWLVIFGMALLAAKGWSKLVASNKQWLWLAFACLVCDLSWPQLQFKPVPLQHSIPNVVQWMGSQSQTYTILELPIKPQVQSNVQADRLWWQTVHRQRSVTGYSGLIPASQVLLARNAAHLPRADVLARIQALGVERIVVYRGTKDGDQIINAMNECTLCQVVYDESDAVVYQLQTSALFDNSLRAGSSLWVSGAENLNDLVALGVVQEMRARGVAVYGPSRQRFYTATQTMQHLPDAWLLGDNEEPESVGVTLQDSVVINAGAVLYRRPIGLMVSQSVNPSQSGQIELQYADNGAVIIDGQMVTEANTPFVTIVFDAALLVPQRIGEIEYAAGAQLVQITLQHGSNTSLEWDEHNASLVRVRVFDRSVILPPLRSTPVQIDIQVVDDNLQLSGWQGGLLLRGIEELSGRAVTYELPTNTQTVNDVVVSDLQDGRYQLLIITPNAQQIVIANLIVDKNSWDWQAIPLKLTLVY